LETACNAYILTNCPVH